MRFVPIESEEAQAVLTVHRARALLVSERTALSNQVRGAPGESGLVFAQGIDTLRKVLMRIGSGEFVLPSLARETVGEMHDRLRATRR
jgi:transposase